MKLPRLDTLAAFFLLVAVAPPAVAEAPTLPWREAGLSERQAAAHLLDRFAYGARPGDIDRVVELGLERWLEAQLAGNLPETALAPRLAGLESLGLEQREILERYPNPGIVLRQRQREGKLDLDMEATQAMEEGDRSALRREFRSAMQEEGFRPQRELMADLYRQKLYRAVYGENQLHEVLTEFWFNHFNVSLADNDVRSFVMTYERDAIRPHVVGDFRALLEATAKHPAMLLYLDNARSVAEPGARTTFDPDRYLRQRRGGRSGFGRRGAARGSAARGSAARGGGDEQRASRRPQGLNENYARELLELHTLGVDGGYDQEDVVEVARAFTGWTLIPPGRMTDDSVRRRLGQARRLPADAGFVFEGDFLFRADAHDAGSKRVLGKKLPAGRGIEDGLAVLDLLAAHPSTARHLAAKVATRFVADEPPAPLVEDLADSFLASQGDLAELIRRLAYHPAFWQPEARQSKIKSPFEVAASALRALDAEVAEARGVLEWVIQSGQPIYAYQAPTGFPDSAENWVNTGSLLARMTFGLELAGGRVPGVRFDLEELLERREPASAEEALEAFLPVLLPERDPSPTLDRLLPVVRDPSFADKVAEAAQAAPSGAMDDRLLPWDGPRSRRRSMSVAVSSPPSATAYVVGLILGSPEFQRR
ncbi:MAG: DUF1800 domain-containing protein [Acidobacteriota bacterium]